MAQMKPLAAIFATLLSFSVVAAEPVPHTALPMSESTELPLEELRMFAEVFSRIKASYVEPVTDKQLLEDAIRGMVSGLDPHSDYLADNDFSNLQEHTNGEFGGIGIEVGMKDGFVHVITPLDDTPAKEAGIKSGDLIIKLGEISIQGMSLSEAVDLMRGKIGEPIAITIMREGEDAPLQFEVVRAAIKIRSVRTRELAPGYGVIRISEFQANTGADLKSAITKLNEKNELKALVLDLRNNPGGVLQAAVEVSDAFLSEGLVVYTEGRVERAAMEFNATAETAVPDIPMVVLINGGSASASEIVAGALQDQGRAVVMGTQSFGKGSVQSVLPLSDSRAVKITTARYFTPNGRSIQAQGITPDIVVKEHKLDVVNAPVGQIREADLEGHLDNPTDAKVAEVIDDDRLAVEDFQLYQAYTMLKALNVLKR
ncbi:S41 family peptidase [Marinobacterium sp. LSUCC0821]|jgi:carboxyl-terminal processing protease|uniref:S41 family peptidase n=1 Tax=Marinobacterium sp. LSUCC0821 TaxID=2668067 RepID=UPI0014524006|nr:S41 family peptidase [Marinobacterium sp. LSUCC0821]QJD71771.1 S41 family peptidase [Marinobacterium sp. LSUCC0821]